MTVRILTGDCRALLGTLPDESVHCVVTSPPYWGLRDYGVDGQLGLEPTPDLYIEHMVDVFREVRRVLRKDGTLWLNMGDCYATGAGKVGEHPDGGAQGARWAGRDDSKGRGTPIKAGGKRRKDGTYYGPVTQPNRMPQEGLKPKDLVMMPARLALALQAEGWWIRKEIIWAKPNPMPESVTNRPTTAHEKIYLCARSERYFYDADAVKEAGESGPSDLRKMAEGKPRIGGKHKTLDDTLSKASQHTNIGRKRSVGSPGTRNLRDVWTIATAPFPGAHFATFPPALVEPCVKAGTSEKGCCPGCGAPWLRVLGKAVPTSGRNSGNRARKFGEDHIPGASHVGRGFPWAPAIPSTAGWAPSCACYDELYLAEFPQPRSARKRHQRAAWGDRWKRVRRRPGLDTWNVAPALTLDPFGGAGTVGLVADRLGRDAILLELNPDYADMARRRIAGDAPLFAEVAE